MNLENINLSELSKFITNQESKSFFLGEPGKEHYKLLAYFSTLFDESEISEIGTFRGCSALALSYNKSNKVYSYDVSDSKTLNGKPDNIEFIITDGSIPEQILNSKIIFVDTLHLGDFEKEVYDFLKKNLWSGILIYDDIYLNDNMKKFWKKIKGKKDDLTESGHWSGTGVVYL